MKPTIINKSSDFVVITYWWGRGNKNKNTQRPCPEDLEEGEKITKRPIQFQSMINRWKASCRNAKCNYMAVEFPEFAKKGGYQKAINYKPRFILEAMKACYPRNVLYIDGDMLIKKYPTLFDIKGVDYMSQGWNNDPRSAILGESRDCYYPYVFETSGGTMFFSNNDHAKAILKEWSKQISKHPGKAEDRLISQIFNNHQLKAPTTTIQLPIEYLWLNIDYDHLPKSTFTRSRIYIEHPECLTGEDRAYEEGAASDRYPSRYHHQITNHIKCTVKTQKFYEYIFFDNARQVSTMRDWLKYMSRKKLLDVVKYKNKYGPYNKNYKKNIIASKNLEFEKFDGIVYLVHRGSKLRVKNKYVLNRIRDLFPVIMHYLHTGNDVIYVPKGSNSSAINSIKKRMKHSDLVCKNTNQSLVRYKKKYTLKVGRKYPMYFCCNNSVLKHLVNMSNNLSDFERRFNGASMFLSRIHCSF